MRDAYCETLMAMAEENNDIVALDADLVSSSGMKPFFKSTLKGLSTWASLRRI